MSSVCTPLRVWRLSVKTTSCIGVSVEGFVVVARQSVRDIARIEYRSFCRLAQAVVAVSLNVGQRAKHHAVVAKERFDAADRLRIVEVEFKSIRRWPHR